MDYRRLAGTDIDLSVLCFGPTRTAAAEPGDDPRTREGIKAFSAVLASGINCIHSSYEYRLGSMAMMSSVLKDHPKRHDIHHIVKVPAPDFEDNDTFTEAKFRQRVEEALTMFHAERISVVQYMWRSKPNDEARLIPMLPRIIDDVTGTFERLRDEGKVGCMMTMPYTVPAAKAAIDTGRFRGLLDYYNPLTMGLTKLFPELQKRKMGFIAIRPYYEGLLTDKRPNPASLPADDRLHAYDISELFRRRDAIAKAFAEEIAGSMTRFALRFPLFSELTATVVVGLNTEKQVSDAVGMVGQVKPRPDLIQKAFELWQSDFSAKVPA